MSIKRRGLAQGRGLEALLGNVVKAQTEIQQSQTVPGQGLAQLPIDSLQRGVYQPRREIPPESLTELSESIRRHGIMQPIVVRALADQPDRYEIIAGERRWRAAQQAGLTDIPAIIRELSDELAIALALIENIQREDLSPIEQAIALQRFHDEFGLSHQEIADAVGKARATVSNLLRLLSLHPEVKTMMEHGDLDMGHARALLALQPHQQLELAKEVVGRGLSVRQTEQLIRSLLNPAPAKPEKSDKKTDVSDIEQLKQQLSEHLGAAVDIDHHRKGKGKVVIRYHSLDELGGILARMRQ